MANDRGFEARSGVDPPMEGVRPPRTPPGGPPDGPGRAGWLWTWVISASLLAGFLAWLGGEAAQGYFVLTEAELQSGVSSLTPTDNTPYLRARRRVAIQNSALHYGILGVALGLGLGLAGGMSRRSAAGMLAGGGAGALVCGVAAVLASLALIPVFLSNYQHDQPNLFLPLAVHGGIWSAIGAAGGVALTLGLGRGQLARAVLGGVAGAVVGAVAYELIYAVAFPLARSESPVPGEPSIRLLAHMITALTIALGVALSARAGGRAYEVGESGAGG